VPGAYVGAGAHGRNGFYYVCRTRQAKGARACSGRRVPADDLEAAVVANLLDTYTRFDLLEHAASDAYAEAADECPRLEAEDATKPSVDRNTAQGDVCPRTLGSMQSKSANQRSD
jgi:hypothetical protein